MGRFLLNLLGMQTNQCDVDLPRPSNFSSHSLRRSTNFCLPVLGRDFKKRGPKRSQPCCLVHRRKRFVKVFEHDFGQILICLCTCPDFLDCRDNVLGRILCLCHFVTHVLKRNAIMSTGVQKCDVPLITSSVSYSFPPILLVHWCASLAPWFIAAAAHSFTTARPFAKAFLAHALARSIALTRTSSRSSKSNCCGLISVCSHCSLVQPSSEGEFAISSSKPICTSRCKADLMS